jgi:hypothetical protein
MQSLLAQTANPEAPNEVNVSQPSDALTARAAAAGSFDSLFLGLGAVALIVGAVGVDGSRPATCEIAEPATRATLARSSVKHLTAETHSPLW